jgi:alpha-tubulin suppressor-like RCC1 family protein
MASYVAAVSTPVQIGSLTNWLKISNGGSQGAHAIKTDGTLWGWGLNSGGRIGDGSTTNTSSPNQIGSLTTWLSVAHASHGTLAITTDGKAFSWGYGTNGMGGHGNTTDYSSPVQIGSLTNWLFAGYGHTTQKVHHAITTDGTLFGWGYNAVGNLGLGNATAYSSPVQVGSLTSWLKVSSCNWGGGAIRT